MAWQRPKGNFYADVKAQEAHFQGVQEDTYLLSVVRHFLMAPKQAREDWKCTSIFQTTVCCGTGALMLIIAGGINMNVAVYATVERLKLPMESHPQPQKVAWINSTSILVTKRCLVSIYCGQYNDFTWCDFIPMDVTHRIGSPFPLRLRCVS